MSEISIKGLDKADVLAALFNHSKQQGLGLLDLSGKSNLTADDARKELAQNPDGYFDYLRGRVLKVKIAGESFDPRLYDRDNGHGTAQQAIDSIKAK